MTTILPDSSRLSGRRVLPRQSVTVLAEPICVGHANSDSEAVGIELIHEGTVIREIHVQCPCGQTLVLECEYPTDATVENTVEKPVE